MNKQAVYQELYFVLTNAPGILVLFPLLSILLELLLANPWWAVPLLERLPQEPPKAIQKAAPKKRPNF